jgi:hypothetical protein
MGLKGAHLATMVGIKSSAKAEFRGIQLVLSIMAGSLE